MTDEPRIVSACMTAVADLPASMGGKGLSKAIEAAMVQSVVDALAEGISIENTVELLARKQAARARVLARAKG